MDRQTNEARYFPEGNEDRAAYSLGTLSLHNGQQSLFSPIRNQLDPHLENRRRLQVVRSMPEIASLANQIVAEKMLELIDTAFAQFVPASVDKNKQVIVL